MRVGVWPALYNQVLPLVVHVIGWHCDKVLLGVACRLRSLVCLQV